MILNKDILAKLLATENLTVVHDNVRTASFNVKDRILTLPQWDDMESYTYDHLVGHEVGHALYTPMEGWHESVSTKGAGYKSYLNVIEDARIERMIQARYPGLRRDFVKSYKKMLADGFFGDDIEGINNYDLIDRINVYFKAGVTSGVRLTAEEMVWVREIEAAQTWEQVVDIADRMYGMAKEKMEQEKQEQAAAAAEEEAENSFDDEFGEGEGEGDETEDDAEGNDSDAGDDDESEGDEEGDEEGDDSTPVGEAKNADEPTSVTDDALRQSINTEYSTDPDINIMNININENVDLDYVIVGYKEVLNLTSDISKLFYNHWHEGREEQAEKLYSEFMANNKKTINYLVKEFEMKKSASNYARAFVSKTGVIDPVLMNSYKYNDDIFRKATIVPDGKNHGMIMYLDWSGSMHRDMKNTVEQTLNLVYFCRQVNIPFRVYAFTNKWECSFEDNLDYHNWQMSVAPDSTMPQSQFRLVEFFNNKMNKMQFARMTKVLLAMSNEITYLNRPFSLGGTPLDDAIIIAPHVYDRFQKMNKVDVVNTIFLTDGDSHPFNFTTMRESSDGSKYPVLHEVSDVLGWSYRKNDIVNLNDTVIKKKIKLRRNTVTKQLLQNYRLRTGSNVIGYRIMPASKHFGVRELENFGMTWAQATELWETLKKDKYITIPGAGYTKFFALKGGKELETANGHFEVAEDAKKGQILSAFRRANKGKLVSRSLLNEFIKEVA